MNVSNKWNILKQSNILLRQLKVYSFIHSFIYYLSNLILTQEIQTILLLRFFIATERLATSSWVLCLKQWKIVRLLLLRILNLVSFTAFMSQYSYSFSTLVKGYIRKGHVHTLLKEYCLLSCNNDEILTRRSDITKHLKHSIKVFRSIPTTRNCSNSLPRPWER